MEYSCLKTLAGKHNSTTRKTISKYHIHGGSWGIPYETKKGRKYCVFADYTDAKDSDSFTDSIIPYAIRQINNRTTLEQRLSAKVCELCGKADVPLEIHHVNKVKNLKGKQQWEIVMIAKKRKTLTVCKDCHHKIHHP